MSLSSMAARLAESGANLNDEAACALALHASGYRPGVIAFELTGAIAAARRLCDRPTSALRPVVLRRGERGRFERRAA